MRTRVTPFTLIALVRDLSAPALLESIRRSEWVVLAFLLYAGLLAAVLPISSAIQVRVARWNFAVVLGYAIVLCVNFVNPRAYLRIARDWLPLAIVLLGYREMGWFAQPHAGAMLESRWIIWDRLLLRHGAKALIEALGPVLPSVLEIAYSMVYLLAPFSIVVLYLTGRRERLDAFLFVFVLGVLLCYAQFPFWPSEPPRVEFYGQDAPSYDTIFRRFNLWMLGNYGIHTSVFPSAHVAGAFAAALGMRYAAPRAKLVNRILPIVACLIGVATVYGRYHYSADAAAGLLIAAGVFVLVFRLEGKCPFRAAEDAAIGGRRRAGMPRRRPEDAAESVDDLLTGVCGHR